VIDLVNNFHITFNRLIGLRWLSEVASPDDFFKVIIIALGHLFGIVVPSKKQLKTEHSNFVQDSIKVLKNVAVRPSSPGALFAIDLMHSSISSSVNGSTNEVCDVMFGLFQNFKCSWRESSLISFSEYRSE
jgi:hypothetical protein